MFDSSGEGTVSRRFLTTAFVKNGQASMAEIEEIMAALDTNNDGHIELDDFLKIVIEQKPRTRTSKGFNPRCCFL